MSPTLQIALVALVVILAATLVALVLLQKRRTEKLRGKFGDAEYAHALEKGKNRRQAEAGLEDRAERVEGLHVQPLAAADRTRFEESWTRIQSHFVDGPGGTVAEADQLLRDVMTTRGYPVGDFEQLAADISVDHPLVMKNYRTAHEIALRQTKGQASTEDLRQAMIHYRTLFGELVGEQTAA